MLFIMRATSCSGKDVFIEHNFPNRNHVLSSDDFREMMLGDRASQQQNKRIFDTMYDIMECRFLNRVNWTVLNATNLRIRDIGIPLELSKKYQVPVTIISIMPPTLEELVERGENRTLSGGLSIPQNVFERHLNRYEASKEPFIKEAVYNDLCTFVEIDQSWRVTRHVI